MALEIIPVMGEVSLLWRLLALLDADLAVGLEGPVQRISLGRASLNDLGESTSSWRMRFALVTTCDRAM